MSTWTDRRVSWARSLAGALALCLISGIVPVHAGKLSWLDEVVQSAMREADAGGKSAVRGTGRLFVHEADESLQALARRSDDLARLARNADQPTETALRVRFQKLVGQDADMARTFASLAPAERRLVVEMGETAQRLARRYPGRAEPMVRALGVDGLAAVRVYGDDVAEVLVREGPQSVSVLRKAGRGGWAFFNEKVLPNKGKLAAAGVLAVFLANPEKFVDTAGRATQYAVEQFAKAGISLAGAVAGGAARGLDTAVGQTLARYGLDSRLTRTLGMVAAGLVAALALLVILGMPARQILRPITWPARVLTRGWRRAVKAAEAGQSNHAPLPCQAIPGSTCRAMPSGPR